MAAATSQMLTCSPPISLVCDVAVALFLLVWRLNLQRRNRVVVISQSHPSTHSFTAPPLHLAAMLLCLPDSLQGNTEGTLRVYHNLFLLYAGLGGNTQLSLEGPQPRSTITGSDMETSSPHCQLFMCLHTSCGDIRSHLPGLQKQ